MRLALLALLTLTALTSGVAYAGDDKAVNTVCPGSGDKVDPDLKPITVTTKDGKMVVIAVCCKDCIAEIKKEPDKFAAAALANQKAK
jgi:hypothetical protein